MLGLYLDNGKENGNYCLGFRDLGLRSSTPKPEKVLRLILSRCCEADLIESVCLLLLLTIDKCGIRRPQVNLNP